MSNERHELQRENERLREKLAQLRTRVGGIRIPLQSAASSSTTAQPTSLRQFRRPCLRTSANTAWTRTASPSWLRPSQSALGTGVWSPNWSRCGSNAPRPQQSSPTPSWNKPRSDNVLSATDSSPSAETCHQLHRGELSFDELEGQLVHMFVLNAHLTAKLSNERRSNILRGAKIPTEWHNTFHQLADRTGEKLFDGDCFAILKQHDEEQRHIRQLAVKERKLKQANKPKKTTAASGTQAKRNSASPASPVSPARTPPIPSRTPSKASSEAHSVSPINNVIVMHDNTDDSDDTDDDRALALGNEQGQLSLAFFPPLV